MKDLMRCLNYRRSGYAGNERKKKKTDYVTSGLWDPQITEWTSCAKRLVICPINRKVSHLTCGFLGLTSSKETGFRGDKKFDT